MPGQGSDPHAAGFWETQLRAYREAPRVSTCGLSRIRELVEPPTPMNQLWRHTWAHMRVDGDQHAEGSQNPR